MSDSIVLLDKGVHDRNGFDCRAEPLTRYLREHAAADARKAVSVCYVLAADEAPSVVIGYYTLSSASIELARIPPGLQRKLPRYPDVPATKIGRLAVSRVHEGKGVGEKLLIDALNRVYEASHSIGSAIVLVDAKNESAASFYKKYGFQPLTSETRQLYIPMATVGQLF